MQLQTTWHQSVRCTSSIWLYYKDIKITWSISPSLTTRSKEYQITNSYSYGISNNRLSNATQGKQGAHTLAGWLLSVSVIFLSQASSTYVRTRNVNHCPLLDNLQTNLIGCSLSTWISLCYLFLDFFMDHQLCVHREFTELFSLMAHNAYRLLLPLNVCRKKNFYLPWECEHERHEYERCVFCSYLPLHLSLDMWFVLDVSTMSKFKCNSCGEISSNYDIMGNQLCSTDEEACQDKGSGCRWIEAQWH